MIYNLIGSGILVAVGAAGMWAVMYFKLAAAKYDALEWKAAAARSDEARMEAEDEADANWGMFSRQARAGFEERATISRLSDTVGQLQDKRDKTLEYCKQFRVRGAVVAEMLRGDRA